MMKNKGITLVALIITIIILLILAGVSLSFVFNGGILDKTQQAVNEYENASQKEQDLLNKIDEYIKNELVGDNSDVNEGYNGEPNAPKLTEGMIPVKYNETIEKWVITNANDEDWYNYNNKQWANVMLSDGKYKTSNPGEYTTDGTTEVEISDLGSMFVWIPRYAYKIESGYHSSTAGTIDVKFLRGSTNEAEEGVNIVEYNEETTANYTKFPEGYVVHPAFTNKVEVGGWDKEINGIWVAKFEAGYPMEGSKDSTLKTSSDMYYPVFKGQKYSYNWTTVGNLYKLGREMSNSGNPYEITSSSNSHIIKNSEWGAVAYLSQSKYGKNSEVYPNNVSFEADRQSIAGKSVYAITGYSAAGVNDGTNNAKGQTIGETIGNSTVWYKEAGYEASTTGNITGIYDMSGGCWDYTANVIPSGHSNIGTYGGEIATIASTGKSNRYITLYPVGGSTSAETDTSRSYSAWGQMYGDSVWEVSSGTGENLAWNGDRMDEDTDSGEPFFVRGAVWGWNSQAGVFALADSNGNDNHHCTSRAVFVVE